MNEAMPPAAERDRALDAFLVTHRLARHDEPAQWSALTGGVSSDIWRVDLPGRSLCVKRALARLKVAAEWTAPVNRNAYEWAWLQFAAKHCPDNVPVPLAHDPQAGLFAMSFLAPEAHPVWKRQLLDGEVEVQTARAVGQVLGHLHVASAGDPQVAAVFDSEGNFRALRLDPYLVATARRHPVVASHLLELAERTAAARIALVHGDVSPKNILVGPNGPVLLDAECAWYGDPAFDLAFCLNHLLLKCVVRPDRQEVLVASFAALAEAYLAQVSWEAPDAVAARTAHLLPALLLARVDGKSPVEYLTQEVDRACVRESALVMLQAPPQDLTAIGAAWLRALRGWPVA